MSTTTLPLLLPASVLGTKSESDPQEWKPSRYLQAPQPPPTDDSKQHDLEMAAARQLIDGKAFKKVRPRRTVDYFAGVGRWTLVSPCIPRWRRNLTRTIVTQDVVESAVPTVHEASSAVHNRCMEPFGPMRLYRYFTEYIMPFVCHISSSSHRRRTQKTLRHRYVPSSFTRRQTRFGVR